MDILIFCALVLLLVLVVLWIYCWINGTVQHNVFFPSRENYWSPDNCEDIKINTSTYDQTTNRSSSHINAWHIDHKGKKIVLFCHGTTGNITHRRYIIDMCKHFGLNILVFDYRGYGKSPGKPTADSVLRDGEVAYHYLCQYYDPSDIIVWGESLGGAVATYIASKYTCHKLILFSTFSSIDDVVAYSYNMSEFKKPINFFFDNITNTLPSKYALGKVNCPVLIIHSDEDEYVPYQCALENHSSVSHSNKHLLTIKGKHAGPNIGESQFKQILYFCDVDTTRYSHLELKSMLKRFEKLVREAHLGYIG